MLTTPGSPRPPVQVLSPGRSMDYTAAPESQGRLMRMLLHLAMAVGCQHHPQKNKPLL